MVTGIAIMSATGGATFAHTHDMAATIVALLASAAAPALLGPKLLARGTCESGYVPAMACPSNG